MGLALRVGVLILLLLFPHPPPAGCLLVNTHARTRIHTRTHIPSLVDISAWRERQAASAQRRQQAEEERQRYLSQAERARHFEGRAHEGFLVLSTDMRIIP